MIYDGDDSVQISYDVIGDAEEYGKRTKSTGKKRGKVNFRLPDDEGENDTEMDVVLASRADSNALANSQQMAQGSILFLVVIMVIEVVSTHVSEDKSFMPFAMFFIEVASVDVILYLINRVRQREENALRAASHGGGYVTHSALGIAMILVQSFRYLKMMQLFVSVTLACQTGTGLNPALDYTIDAIAFLCLGGAFVSLKRHENHYTINDQ